MRALWSKEMVRGSDGCGGRVAQASRVNMTAPEVVIGTSAIVDVSGRGDVSGDGVGAGGAGGTFGGSGGLSECGETSAPYYAADSVIGDLDVCDSLTVGSGGGVNGGRGGGGVWIFSESIAVSGAILADGAGSNATAHGSGSGGAVCLSGDSLVLLGKVSAIGGTSTSTGSGNGGGGRVTLKYCDLLTADWAETDCHGGDDHGLCVNGGAGTRYDVLTCNGTAKAYTAHIDNAGIETQALTLLDDAAVVPAGVTLNEVTVSNSAALGTRQVTVKATENASGALQVSGGCVVVPVGDDVDGSWSSPDTTTVTLNAAEVVVRGTQVVSDNVQVTTTGKVELDGASSIQFSGSVSVHAGGELNVLVRVCCLLMVVCRSCCLVVDWMVVARALLRA